jgi:DNA-binding NarL/FixJ family response regulator
MPITVLIVDDHELIHNGISSMLSETNTEIIGNAYDGENAVRLTEELRPDLVVLDVSLVGMSGVETLERILMVSPTTKVIMLSTFANPTYIARSVIRGASDYLVKSAGRGELLSTISRAVQGIDPPDTSLFSRIKELMSRRKDKHLTTYKLTNREVQVLRHLGLGLSNAEIATSLAISIETVKEHVQNILRKTNASDRTQVAVWAVREHLI